ncbi:MAG TPA: hypothetical protein VNW97_20455, partial [Candidatus Saccharimonadales bacterium]|nr:hypothetical protein [Candidatus Saccharimonadales bacterium]
MKRTIAAILFLAAFACCLNGSAQAQYTSSCPLYTTLQSQLPTACLDGWPPLDFAHLPPTAVCCNPAGSPFGQSCLA